MQASGLPIARLGDAAALGGIFGREQTVYAAVARDDAGGEFIERIEVGAARWRGYRLEQHRLTRRSGPRTTSDMTEQKEETKPTKPLTLSTTARAGAAKSSDATQVRQKFSHGRTRAVTVEVKKPVKRAGGARACGGDLACPGARGAGCGADRPHPEAGRRRGRARGTRALRRARLGRRHRPAAAAASCCARSPKKRRKPARGPWSTPTATPKSRASARPRKSARRAVEDEARKKADEEHKKRLAEEEARKKVEEEVKRKADALVQKRLDQAATASPHDDGRAPGPGDRHRCCDAPTPRPRRSGARRSRRALPQTANAALRRPPMRPAINKRLPQPPGARREVPKRRSDKVDVGRAVEGENDFRSRSAAQMRRRLERDRRREHDDEPQQKVFREVTIPETITVQELANRMAERGADVIKTLMQHGRDGDHQPGDRRRHRRAGGDGIRPPAQARLRGRRRDRPGRDGGRRRRRW